MYLRDWRESAGLSQKELAELAGICRASVSHVENGRYLPSPSFAGKVARALSQELRVSVHTWDIFPGQFKPLRVIVPIGEQAPLQDREQRDAS